MPSPADFEVLLRLARQDLAGGRPAGAQEKCLQVLSTHQHHPGALEVLGEALFAQGRTEDAVRVFNALTLMQPTVAAHWQNLGTVLRPAGRLEQALAALQRALQLGAPSAGLLYNLGALQMERCDYNAAYLALRDAVALAPADARIRWVFALCCYDLTRFEEAIAALESWQQLQGLTLDMSVDITLLLVMMGAVQQDDPAIQQLLANPPQGGRTALRFASMLERLHRLDEARATLERLELSDPGLEADPEKLLMSAVLADRAGQYEVACQQLSVALGHEKELTQRHKLLYPLAKALDALGRYDEAYAAAAEAHRSQVGLLEAMLGKAATGKSQIESLTASGCDPEDVATWGHAGPAAGTGPAAGNGSATGNGPAIQDSPIFIVGFPRSGTTLLEQVLDAHPLLQSMDEQPSLLRTVAEVTGRGLRYPAELGKLSAQALDEIRAHYWEHTRKRVQLLPGQRVVDKYPLNLILVPLIRRLFPNAHTIVAIRHPCDTVLSCFLQHFRPPELALACRDLGTLAQTYARAFGFWYSQSTLLRPPSYELRYEQLTADFATEVRNVSEFLQLPWNEAMLAPGEHARGKGFNSTPSYAQVLAPVNSRSVGRWKHYERHFGAALAELMPWIERWGYSL